MGGIMKTGGLFSILAAAETTYYTEKSTVSDVPLPIRSNVIHTPSRSVSAIPSALETSDSV